MEGSQETWRLGERWWSWWHGKEWIESTNSLEIEAVFTGSLLGDGGFFLLDQFSGYYTK